MTSNFFIDFYKRFTSDNPAFFKYIQVFSLVAAAVIKAPEFLASVGFTISEVLPVAYTNITAIFAAIVAIIAQLPKIDPAASVKK